MIELVSKDQCCGCYACYNACKSRAIEMKIDLSGFWYPEINPLNCIECRACIKVCPSINKTFFSSNNPKAYIVQHTDEKVRQQSTSGGAFTGIAEQIIMSLGGVVFGAVEDKNFDVFHCYVDSLMELYKFQGSKYVQSRINYTYSEAEKFLKDGIHVCFSGTPCQIYGLKQYLKKDYENLLTVDVMCRAVPSPKILKKYLSYQKRKYPSFDYVKFRDKGRGYSYPCLALYNGDKIIYRRGSESDPFLRLFLNGYCNREICYACPFQNGTRASDITLWDCWHPEKYASDYNDNKGTTNVIAWTDKGNKFLTDGQSLRVKEIGITNIDANLFRDEHSIKKANCNLEKFYLDAENLNEVDFFYKYAPVSVKIKLKGIIRYLIYFLHLHDYVRKIIHKTRTIGNQI